MCVPRDEATRRYYRLAHSGLAVTGSSRHATIDATN
jgi:hypothetical protein